MKQKQKKQTTNNQKKNHSKFLLAGLIKTRSDDNK